MKKYLLFAILCLVMTTSCQSSKSARYVLDNVLYCHFNPNLVVAVDPEIPFIAGKQENSTAISANSMSSFTCVNSPWWVFADSGVYGDSDNYMERGVLVELSMLPANSNWEVRTNSLNSFENALMAGSTQMFGHSHDFVVAYSGPPCDEKKIKYLEEQGYKTPGACIELILFRKAGRRTFYSITYFESYEGEHLFFGETPPFREEVIGGESFYSLNEDFSDEFLKRASAAFAVSDIYHLRRLEREAQGAQQPESPSAESSQSPMPEDPASSAPQES
ncbi:hypothetical protein [Desulfatibacillum aliphaticivorans]|uniref:hypothetical protein n=1 Tax=Desulfatibacillum aliphaticivorans TaxID=218208 RepID=UPI0004046FAC|nr:hypothetical protein [Desulfatibacillum aliphaticivorans]